MTILMFSTDERIFESHSEAQERMRDYGTIFDALHIVVCTRNNEYKPIVLDNRVYIYPARGANRIYSLYAGYQAGKALLKTYSFSAITSQDPFELGIVSFLLARLHKVPLQLQVHTDFLSAYFFKESLKNKVRVLIAKWLLPRAQGIRVVSERIKAGLTDRCGIAEKLITVLPIFVDVKKIQNKKIKTDLRLKYLDYNFRILMASRLTKEKNIECALAAFVGIVKKYPHTILVIVGDGPEEVHLKKLVEALKLGSNVRFEPWSADLVSYYKTADVFISASNYEGYGRTIIEAMASQVSVIMTDVGLAGEILVDDLDGKVIPVNDSIALQSAIETIMVDQEKRENFINESSKVINSLDSHKEYLEKYRQTFERL